MAGPGLGRLGYLHFLHQVAVRLRHASQDVCQAYRCAGKRAPKMLSIGLHPRMIGRPGRMGALDSILRHITGSGHAWVAPRADIARHWLRTFPDTMGTTEALKP